MYEGFNRKSGDELECLMIDQDITEEFECVEKIDYIENGKDGIIIYMNDTSGGY